jgi:multidrug efflux pump subunit AcrA (membrane-fusion protein)
MKIATTILVLFGVVLLSFGCSSDESSSTTSTKTYTVTKSSISVAVTGTGNLALSRAEDLAFDVSGTVEEVLVTEGETVTEGQELARLDTSEWDTQLRTLNKALSTAKRNLTTAERAATTAENSVAKSERNVTSKELALRQAKIDLDAAEDNLSKIAGVKAVQDDIDNAQDTIDFANRMLSGEFAGAVQLYDVTYWLDLAAAAKTELADAQQRLQDIVDGTNLDLSDDVARQVAIYQLQIEKTQLALEEAEAAVDDANLAVPDAQIAAADAQIDLEDARENLTSAQDDLDEAENLSPIVKAPFDGFITKINVEGGDEVTKGTVAMQLADPNQFAAEILVSEDDIFSIEEGAEATVSLDALSDLSYPAKITKISPTASVSSGVVNYAVTVTLTSTQPITATQVATFQPPSTSIPGMPSDNSTTSTPPFGISQNSTGRIQPPNAFPGVTSSSSSTSTTSSSVTLKDGLSATVSIVSEYKDNILVVPSKAITRKSGVSTVQVVTDSGTETRTVTTGITDGSYTEITAGLSEGEQVAITTSTSSSSTSGTTNTNMQGGMQIIGGQGSPPGGGF